MPPLIGDGYFDSKVARNTKHHRIYINKYTTRESAKFKAKSSASHFSDDLIFAKTRHKRILVEESKITGFRASFNPGFLYLYIGENTLLERKCPFQRIFHLSFHNHRNTHNDKFPHYSCIDVDIHCRPDTRQYPDT